VVRSQKLIASLGDTGNWPRNGAELRGTLHTVKGEKWLEVSEIKQRGKSDFAPVGAQNAWMPESGGAGNGGKWLHPVGSKTWA
ncbi:hypothetical protein B484DRAFT_404085, partial [Ochromonadaceae sp. CCMP2298]